MLTVDFLKSYGDLLVLYVMKVINVAMCTRSMMKLCYEMLMKLERIFMLCNMTCNVSYGASCIFVCHLHPDTSPLYHERMKFDIYVCHDIMQSFSVLWCLATCKKLCPTKPGSRGTYTSPPGVSMCTYMGRVWRGITHPTLPRIEKHSKAM